MINLSNFNTYLYTDGNTCSDVCDQFCIQENSSPKCACDNGYYLHSDGVSCLGRYIYIYYSVIIAIYHADINECLTTYYDCAHAECINTNGSFLCVCDPGFISYGNNNNCMGKHSKNNL